MQVTVSFQFERETKNMVRFKEVPIGDMLPVIGTLYISKKYLKDEIDKEGRYPSIEVLIRTT